MGPEAMISVFGMLSFKPFSSFTLIKRLFSSSSLSAIRVVSCTKLRLLIFLPPILIPAYNSSSLAFLMMCSVYRLNKQGNSRQPCCTPFSILNQSVVPYGILTVASWPTYRFLRRQVRWSGTPVSLTVFHSLLWSTQSKALSEAEVDVFWNSLGFSMILWMLAIWSLVPLPFINPACTSGSTQFTYCWSLAWRIFS